MTGSGEESWRCACGEVRLLGSSECWKCGAVYSREGLVDPATMEHGTSSPGEKVSTPPPAAGTEAASLPADRSPLKKPWTEVAVVLLLTVFPWFCSALWDIFRPAPQLPFVEASFFSVIWNLQVIAPVIFIIARSGQPWSHFGIVRPQLILDGFLAFIIFAIGFGLSGLLRPLITLVLPGPPFDFPRPAGPAEHLLLILTKGVNGFAEELILRGYLIPRLETLTGSTAKSIVLSSVLFASYHIYQGPASSIQILIMGLIFGSFFAITRRICPLVLAHASFGIFAYVAR